MGNILVFIQGIASEISKASLSATNFAFQIKDKWSKNEVYAIALGVNAKAIADSALEYGFQKVFYSENEQYSKYIAKNYSDIITSVAKENLCDSIVAVTSSITKDFFPMVAVGLDAGQASDVIALNDDGSLKRPMYAGNIISDIEITSANKLITVRSSSFDPYNQKNRIGESIEISNLPKKTDQAEVLSYDFIKKDRPDLNEARIIVSGGRGLVSKENFEKYIFPLADKLGAAIGASRAVVDAGFVPNDWQVGQTGKVVAPDLYFAIGISGAIQHLAGMKDSKVIVAINKDAEAPIFEIADYGLVADVFTALPELIDKL